MLNTIQKIDWRLTFVLDVAVFVLFFSTGTAVVPAVFLTELIMWLARLIWLSPMMLRFILRRLVHMIPILVTIVAFGFLLIQIAPGDVFTQLALSPNVRPEDLELFRERFGLTDPWYIQFFKYLWRVMQGDFGYSELFKSPVFSVVRVRAAATITLSVTSLVLAWGFSIPAGIMAATRQYKWQDQTVSVFAFVGLAIPNFFLAFLLLYIVSVTSTPPGTWLPIGGMLSLDHARMGLFEQIIDRIRHLIIPVFVIGTGAMAGLTRIMRANMLDIMNQQYIVTARSKGQTEKKVVYRHALRNAINPMITILGFQIASILSGQALVENVIAWPGLGRVALQAVISQDTFLVMGVLIYSSILLVVGNLIADILLAMVDPRIRIG
ncbi:MAG: ABC transporter permease [Spirochaetaceae bacterium]|nr:MAG: ABC transporter permease [Spirochaetaceae bacterium]